jgi:hypothetical protein
MTISTHAGAHRVSWDLHYNPMAPQSGGGGEEEATGAVPHRTYPAVNAPWAPPGRYTVRLTANNVHYAQPLTLRLDPRVTTPAAGLAQLAKLSREMYDGALAAHAAYQKARALSARLETMNGEDIVVFKARVDSLAPAPMPARGRGFLFGRRGGDRPPSTLNGASDAMMEAAMAMQRADVTPTATEAAACVRARAASSAVMRRWAALETSGLAALNTKRKALGQPTVH